MVKIKGNWVAARCLRTTLIQFITNKDQKRFGLLSDKYIYITIRSIFKIKV